MDVKEAIENRQSIRKYSPKKVSFETIAEILAIAKHAPSSGNLQNWRFIIVTDKEKRENLAEASLKQTWMASAPIHLVVCNKMSDVGVLYGDRGKWIYSIQNCAIIGSYILILARNFGLEACWVGAFDEDEVRKILEIPDDIRPEAILTIGYSEEKRLKKTKRRDIENTTFIDTWGNREK